MKTYKIRVNRPCYLFIDDKEVQILDEMTLTEIRLHEGEHLRRVVAIDNPQIIDEAKIVLSESSELDDIVLDLTGLEDARQKARPTEEFQVGDLKYDANNDAIGVAVVGLANDSLTVIDIPEDVVYRHYRYKVTMLGHNMFEACTKLTSITIPNSVTHIGHSAFAYCEGLTSIIIPDGVKFIGYHAFSGCSGLISITIPSSVIFILEGAFNECTSLTSITIPSSVTLIEDEAFSSCHSLQTIRYTGTKRQWKKVKKGIDLYYEVLTDVVECSDGDVEICTSEYGY